MIAYLKGTIVNIRQITNQKTMLTLEVNNIGYEMQISPSWGLKLELGENLQIFTHSQTKEEQMVLYGFVSAIERDLFQQLLTVSGVGAQVAIALLDTLGITDLVQAIVTCNTKMLIQTPGVGGKTAERISLELKTKLTQWRKQAGIIPVVTKIKPAIREEVEMTLLALGYNQQEIAEALLTLSEDKTLAKSEDPEEWIRTAIRWLTSDIGK
jgi:holliday junction DNA helicase RuvA